MASRRSLYYLRPIRPIQTPAEPPPPPPPPLTPETALDRLLWLDPAFGAEARGATALNGTNQYLRRTSPAGLALGTSNNLIAGFWCRPNVVPTTPPTWMFTAWETGTNHRSFGFSAGRAINENGLFQARISSDGTSTANALVPFANLGAYAPNTWYFLMLGYDHAADLVRARGGTVSAAAAAETPASSPGVFSSAAPLLVGGTSTSGVGANLFDGRVQSAFVGNPPSLDASTFNSMFDLLHNGGSGRSYASLDSAEKGSLGIVSWFELSEPAGVRGDSHGVNHLEPFGGPTLADGLVVAPASHLAPVRSWTSRVGSGPPAVIEDAVASRPTWHSDGVLVFDGANDRLSGTAGTVIGDRPAFTLLARVRPAALPATNPAVVYTEANAAGTVVNRLAISPSGNVVASYRPSGGALASATSAGMLSPGTDYVIGVRRDGTSLQLFVNGEMSGPAATIAGGSDLAGATARVGGPVESSGLAHFNGRVEAIFAVGQALSDAHIQDLSGAL